MGKVNKYLKGIGLENIPINFLWEKLTNVLRVLIWKIFLETFYEKRKRVTLQT